MDAAIKAEETPQPVRMRFTGEEPDLLRTLIVGTLLQIPTVGFYRFWLTTDVRRHLWSHSQIGDDPFEYTGRARDLLFGFLIALAVLVPVFVLTTIAAIELERLQAFASAPLIVVTYLLGYLAVYSARRYRVTRTVFRGVRFWMTGSAFAYLGRAVLWDLATLLTLGFLYPWRAAALERYKMRNTRYGALNGEFVARGATFLRRAGWIWLLLILALALIIVLAINESWVGLAAFAVPLVIAAPLLVPVFRAIELKWWLEGVRLGPVAAASDLRVRNVYWCYLKTFLMSMLYGMFGGLAATMIVALLFGIALGFTPFGDIELEAVPLFWQIVGGVVVALVYLVFIMGFDVIRRLYLDRGIWAVSVDSVTLTNAQALDEVVADEGDAAGGLGEGLLDALDMGGI